MISPRQGVLVANLLLLGAVAYFAATLVMNMMESRLISGTPSRTVTVAQPQSARVRRAVPEQRFQSILTANIFNAERTAVGAEAEDAGANGTVGPIPPAGVAPDTASAQPPLGLQLTGVMIFGRKAFATVSTSSGGKERVYRRGDCLPALEEEIVKDCQPNQGKLVGVGKDFIRITYQQQNHLIRIAETAPQRPPDAARRPPPRRPAPARTAKKAPRTNGPTFSSREAFPMVARGNTIDVQVPDAEVKKAFENFSDVIKQARVVPYNGKDGAGFQIRSIRPGSIFQRIGLNNFDVIKSVNGQALTTYDQATSLFTAFRNEKEITLDIRRKNKDLKLNYTIE